MAKQPIRRSSSRTDCRSRKEDKGGASLRFVFVGERPSFRAVQIGATWQNGKLSGKTLREALLAFHLDPAAHHYLNLYPHPQSLDDAAWEEEACGEIMHLIEQGYIVVGLGRLVSDRLKQRRIPHLFMIHPAARGEIRRKERYHAHVAATLAQARKERRGCCT